MRESTVESYRTLDELPMFTDVKTIAAILGISQSAGYELMHEEGFPSIKIGGRIIVPRDKFKSWIDSKIAF